MALFGHSGCSLQSCANGGGALALLVLHRMCSGPGLRRCAYRWTRPSGGGRWGHYLRDPRGVHWFAQKCAFCGHGYGSDSIFALLYLQALAGPPSLHGNYACMVYWVKGAFRRNCRQSLRENSFLLLKFFCLVGTLLLGGGDRCSGIFGLVGRASWSVHPSTAVEVFNVGRWLTHGDLVLEAQVDFTAVVEHRLIPARVRSEWARLREKGLATLWAPASQDSPHVGDAGVGVISMRGAPVALPTFATDQFEWFFDCGRGGLILWHLWIGRAQHPGLPLLRLVLRFSTLEGG